MRFFRQPAVFPVLLALGAATLCGCGQKGPLYLRDAPPAGLNPERPAPYKPVPYPPDDDSRPGK
jgi:predicted small lipoprotein YifL